MYITINSIGIKRIKITPNVESVNENVYNKFLKNGVAHFKGTPIPGEFLEMVAIPSYTVTVL